MSDLELLKQDLQIITNKRPDLQHLAKRDEYLESLLASAKSFLAREGIKETDSDEYQTINVQYAAYLFRKRAGEATAMPRYLRWEMNNLLMYQKATE